MTEEWREISDYPDYEVSSLGRVRSWKEKTRWGPAPRILGGCLHLNIRKKVTGRQVTLGGGPQRMIFVHILVLDTFVGRCPDGMECCHNDGDPLNNRVGNLRWDTHHANIQDKRLHGTMKGNVGIDHPFARLAPEDVRCIRAEPKFKGVCQMLSKAFGVSVSQIGAIRGYRKWAALPQHL